MRAYVQATTSSISARLTLVLAACALLVVVTAAGAAMRGAAGPLIGSRNIADNSVRSQDLQNGGIRSIDVANGGLLGVDIRNATIGGVDVRKGTLGASHLSFDVATQGELDALSAPSVLNVPSNKVDWTQLKNVPAGFADGIDDTGGGVAAGDVACTGCVDTTDLAPGAVTSAKLADGTVAVADLAFDPATQAELDALRSPQGTLNAATNPVDWSNLKSVPAGFADNLDNVDGGTAANIACAGCVVIPHLGFNPATQSELDEFKWSLSSAGTPNGPGNPVDWTKLKSIPAGFADGIDAIDGGTAANVACANCITASDVAADVATQADLDALAAAGTINAGTNPLAWSKLKAVPAGIADGDDRTFVIGAGVGAGVPIDTFGGVTTVTVSCGPGDTAIGGAFTSDAGNGDVLSLVQSTNSATDTWTMKFTNTSTNAIMVTPKAICIGNLADT